MHSTEITKPYYDITGYIKGGRKEHKVNTCILIIL